MRRELGHIDDKAESVKQKQQELEERKQELEDRIQEVENGVARLEEELEEKRAVVERLSDAVRREKERLSELMEQKQKMDIEIAKIMANKEARQREIDFTRKRCEELRSELDRVQERMDFLNKAVETNQEQISNIEGLLSSSAGERERVLERLKSAKDLLSKVREDRTVLEKELISLEEELAHIREKSADLEKKLSELEVSIQKTVEILSTLYHIDWNDIEPEELDSSVDEEFFALREKFDRFGEINPLALQEYEEMRVREEELLQQKADLLTAKEDIELTLKKSDERARHLFLSTVDKVRRNFQDVVECLFGGGRGDIVLDGDDPLDANVEVMVSPAGKRLKRIDLLSTGEKTLATLSILFAVYLTKPSPFCVLDEVDAALDDSNVERFTRFLRQYLTKSQILVITHNRRTMEASDYLYGVTTEEPGVSKVVSLKLEEVKELLGE